MLSGYHTKIMCPNCTPNWYALINLIHLKVDVWREHGHWTWTLDIMVFFFLFLLKHYPVIKINSGQLRYICIQVRKSVFVHLCMRHLVISVLISLDQVLSENIWFVWSKPSYSGESGDVTKAGRRRRRRQTTEDSATQ